MSHFVLASGSGIRAELLRNAGLAFAVDPSSVDERAVEEPLLAAGCLPADLASVLAQAKARDVSARRPGDLVIGADQVLDFDGRRLTKPDDMAAARRQLLAMAGRDHLLHSAVALARGGEVLWSHVGTVRLVMRPFGEDFVDGYLATAGTAILSSVGAYQLEGPGIQLFEAIEGDYFTVLGLPLLALLAELRARGEIAA